ncbi:MAG TPA: PVC-type heme-binding CxxCH protein [Isosphaeraceae bacterium]|jgi:putative membrane-bound dehydrogenase-like protein|nr:PVC-type heme-binding CxxCH protein [Isosphaeraceae bacterium]
MFGTGLWLVLGWVAAADTQIDIPRAVDSRLTITLVAAEPDIVTPTGIAIDAAGRVLVIESHTHFRPQGYKGPPADRIRVFEDTDKDGRADRITTFFEGSKWTMGLVVDRDGSVLVATRYEIFRLRDIDGDGKSDQKVTLARLETPGDYPHNGLSGIAVDFAGNIRFGLGENLGASYRLIGSDDKVLAGGGEGGNVFRCKPDGSGLVRVATGFWNPFHLALDVYGRLFGVDNDPDSRPPCRLVHIVDGGDYGYRFRNGRRGLHPFTAWNGELPGTLPMVAGTGEAPSGLVVYESDNLPPDYRGNIVSTSWGDHRIERFRLRPRGGQQKSADDPNKGFILVEIDAQGVIKIDNVQASAESLVERLRKASKETDRKSVLVTADFSTPHRNAVLVYDAANEVGLGIAIAKPGGPDGGASVQATMEPVFVGGEMFRPVGIVTAPDGSLYVSDWVDKSYPIHGKGRIWRIHAQSAPRTVPHDPREALEAPDRRLREAAARRLLGQGESGRKVLEDVLTSDKDERARAVALTALLAQEDQDDSVLRKSLKDASPQIRAMAVRGLPARMIQPERIAAEDTDGAVRAEALRRIVAEADVPVLLKALEDADPFITEAAREGLKRAARLPRLLELAKVENPAQRLGILLVLRDSSDPEARKALPAFLADPDPTIRFAAIQWVGEQNLAEFRKTLTDGLAQGAVTRPLFEAYLAALERLDGVRRDPNLEVAGEDYVAKLLIDRSTAPAVRRRALRTLRADHPALTIARLQEFLASADPELQLEAVRTLRESPHTERAAILQDLARRRDLSPALRAEAILGLPGFEPQEKALLLDLASDPEPAVRHEALRSLRDVPLSDRDRERLQQLKPGDEGSQALLARLLGRLDVKDQPPNRDLQAWLGRLEGAADPAEGERVFFHPKGPGCARCHQVDGRGGRVGPDLSTTGQVLDRARLVQSILEPSKEVAPQFVLWTIHKTDGTVLDGVLLEESPLGEQTYADAQGKPFTLKPTEIEERRPQNTSIMPDDLVRTLTTAELRDLLAYLRHPRVAGNDQ